MISLIVPDSDRPSRLDKSKDEQYHLKWARFCAGSANNNLHGSFLNKIALNKRFYKGDQWTLEEDVEVFLKDDTNQARNRIKIVKNLIRPMVEQYRGNAIRLSVNAKVKSISPLAINRRERLLAKMKFITEVANTSSFSNALIDKYPIGKNEGETEQIFSNLYVDKYVTKLNYLLKYVSELNQFAEMQVRVAEELALTGLGVITDFEYAGNQRFEVVPSDEFFWDRSATRYDLTDAEFMGRVKQMVPSDIFEQFPEITSDEKKAVEDYVRMYKSQFNTDRITVGSRLPVIHTYWRDSEEYEYGYVKDEFGYPHLCRINFTEEGDDKPRYTTEDLIDNDSARAKRVLKGKKSTKIYVDTLRYAIFIPNEVTGSNQNKTSDILLEWGILPYQETENLDYSSVKFPFKAYCWGYVDGEVLSPIDDAINPQRFINRILSVAENQINNSRGSGTVYDKSALDPDEGEDGMLRNMNQSKPVGVFAKGRGIQNVIGSYDSTVKAGTMVMFNIVDTMKTFMQDVTGVNEALKGESTGSDQLVGVTELLIQRGSLMQEPFYHALTSVFLQSYQSIATRGKRIYADNERELAIATGDDGLEILKISKDMNMEDFRCFVKRENVDDMLIQAGNNMILTLQQLQLLDEVRFANLWGRSTPDDVANALRASVKEKQEIGRMQKKQNDAEEQQVQQVAQADKQEQEGKMNMMMQREDNQKLQDHDFEVEKIFAKGAAKGLENHLSPQNNAGNVANTNSVI